MLQVLKVYRYRNSGRLIATGLGKGYVFTLNNDLTFSEKEPHRTRRNTAFEETPYRIEVEVARKGKHNTYRIVRTWNEHHLPSKSVDPRAPLENRIDVSPAQSFSAAEASYVGKSSGHSIGYFLVIGSFFLLFLVPQWGWLPPLLTLTSGILTIWRTSTPGDASKIAEVKDAKERLREKTEQTLNEAMRDVRAWAALDGVGFERAVAKLYRDQGFDVEFTPRTNDHGVDLILRKNGTLSIVQCKAYSKNVGVSAVRELVGVRASWPKATDAVLATLFDFSNPAKTFAAAHNIRLFSVARDYLKTDFRP